MKPRGLILLACLALAGCGGTRVTAPPVHRPFADCSPGGIKELLRGHEGTGVVVVCKNGKVFDNYGGNE